VGLPLKSAGLSIDFLGEGLACYCFQADQTAVSRERVLLATFAGWYAQQRFCDLKSIPCPDFRYPQSTCDWRYASPIVEKLAGGDYEVVKDQLERRSRALVEQYWPVIEILAKTLLDREWEPLKLFKSGWTWAKATTAKYVTGEETVLTLARFGISARCVSEC
jgi:hypothetical protein